MGRNKTHLITALLLLTAASLACWKGPKSTRDLSDSTPTATYSPAPKNDDPGNKNTNMSETKPAKGFEANLPSGFQKPNDDAGRLLLKEYGSVFVARGGTTPPSTVVFRDQAAVTTFQNTLKTSSENIGGFTLELQTPAMEGLKSAIAEAKAAGLSISPRDKDSAKRSYDETIELWKSRVEPALKHWVGLGKMTQADADRIKALSPYEQVPEVLKLEEKGIWFAKDLSKSIIYSVAPPGTSQHLSMLALDVKENEDAKVRAILAKHGWYQTVESDLPHFTFLGSPESGLSDLGLKKRDNGGRTFWVPDI